MRSDAVGHLINFGRTTSTRSRDPDNKERSLVRDRHASGAPTLDGNLNESFLELGLHTLLETNTLLLMRDTSLVNLKTITWYQR